MSSYSGDPGYMNAMQRDDEALPVDRLIILYEQGIEKLAGALEGISQEQARLRPVDGKWSALELVAHLAGTEIFFTERLERTIALDKPLLVGVDERHYPERIGYQDLVLAEEQSLFSTLRKHMARVLRRQPCHSWQRVAIHTETGSVSLRHLLLQPIRHLDHHLVFLLEKRKALGLPT
ncbi:MAG: DinB family protein [Gemmataceae bacterium]